MRMFALMEMSTVTKMDIRFPTHHEWAICR